MTLRSSLIRLAHENPELRKEVLPLLEKEADSKKTAALSPEQVISELQTAVDNLTESLERAKGNVTQWEAASRKKTHIQKERDLVMSNLGGAYAERSAYIDARAEVLRVLNKFKKSL